MMDREEAILYLERMKMVPSENWKEIWKEVAGYRNQIIDMAIESLSQPNYETDTEVRLAVTNRKKEKVILWDAFGEVEYFPIEALSAETHEIRTETHGVCLDLISRADAEAFVCMERCGEYRKDCPAQTCPIIEHLDSIPSADRPTELLKDGTLKVNVKSGAEVNRVLVWGDDGCGGLYYADDRPSGEWIYDGARIASDEEPRLYWKCSECGHEGNPDANYCGFCGAKMGGNK